MDADDATARPVVPGTVPAGHPSDLRDLAARVQDVCLTNGWTVATAESCTGGLVADTLTDIPGSSAYVLGGIVAYADRIKAALLGVDLDLLATRGAVSAHVAKAMALGARARFGTTFALAVTGIAGPGGGSAAKPVGLTFIAVATPARVDIRRHVWSGDRIENKEASARAVMTLLLGIAEKQSARVAAAARGAGLPETAARGVGPAEAGAQPAAPSAAARPSVAGR